MANPAYEQDPQATGESWDELIDGSLVAMSPRPMTRHNLTASNIHAIFFNYLKNRRCVPFADGEDLYLTDRDRFIPDGMIVCDPDKIREDGVYGAPDLVVEVLSPSTARYDRSYKKRAYERSGVKEYWIVNPADRTVEQYLLREEDGKRHYVLHDLLSLFPDALLEKMTEEERSAIPTEFRCSLYEDLVIRLEDIFWRVEA